MCRHSFFSFSWRCSPLSLTKPSCFAWMLRVLLLFAKLFAPNGNIAGCVANFEYVTLSLSEFEAVWCSLSHSFTYTGLEFFLSSIALWQQMIFAFPAVFKIEHTCQHDEPNPAMSVFLCFPLRMPHFPIWPESGLLSGVLKVSLSQHHVLILKL